VEGGVDFQNFEELVRAGADILVVGSAIFHSDNPKARLTELMRLAAGAKQISRV
jgi:pentose-5-phosphate-3-epimerase